VNSCHECTSYNKGKGSRKCLQCHKYEIILKKSVKRTQVRLEVVPQNILEAIEDEATGQVKTILRAIQSLPAQLSLIVAGIYVCGLTYRQLASLLHVSHQSVDKKNKFALDIIKQITE
jgi:DNA-directed RNA polymerase specialized sigma24 family protein